MTRTSERPRESDPAPVSASAWLLLALLTSLNVLNFVVRQLIPSLAPLLIADLGLTRAQIGALVGFAFVIVYSVVGLALGVVADRWPRRALIAGGVTLWSAMTALSGTARSYLALAVPRVLTGIGQAALTPAALGMLADVFPVRRLGLAAGIYYAGLPVGTALSLGLAGWIAPRYGWRACFFIVGAAGLAALALLALTRERGRREAQSDGASRARLKPRPYDEAAVPATALRGGEQVGRVGSPGAAEAADGRAAAIQDGSRTDARDSRSAGASAPAAPSRPTIGQLVGNLRRALADRPVLLLLMIGGSTLTYGSAAATHGVTWLVEERGFTFAAGASVSALMTVASGFFGNLTGGWFSDWCARRWAGGRAWSLVVLILVFAPFSLGFYLLPASSPLFYAAWFFSGASTVAYFGPLFSAVGELAPASVRSSLVAFVLLVINIAGVGPGSLVTGAIGDRASLTSGLVLSVGVGLAGAVVFAAAARAMSRERAVS